MYCASYKQSVGVGVVVNRSEGVGASVSVCWRNRWRTRRKRKAGELPENLPFTRKRGK